MNYFKVTTTQNGLLLCCINDGFTKPMSSKTRWQFWKLLQLFLLSFLQNCCWEIISISVYTKIAIERKKSTSFLENRCWMGLKSSFSWSFFFVNPFSSLVLTFPLYEPLVMSLALTPICHHRQSSFPCCHHLAVKPLSISLTLEPFLSSFVSVRFRSHSRASNPNPFNEGLNLRIAHSHASLHYYSTKLQYQR